MKRLRLWLSAVAALLLLAGCAPQTANPLARNQTTAVPGLDTQPFAATAADANAETVTAQLYFRYLDEPMLAAETRTLTVRKDESIEAAIVQALIEGPSAGHSDLRGLIPADTRLESVASRDTLLFLTFDEGFLKDDVPEIWADSAQWRTDAPVLRALIVQSIVASVTETVPYAGVQILVHKQGELQTNLRLDNSYFLDGRTGPSDPVRRDEAWLLTPQRTGEVLLQAWQQQNVERCTHYLLEQDKPTQAAFAEALAAAPVLTEFAVSGGSVSGDGQTATLSVTLRTQREGHTTLSAAYPLQLTRENGVWKLAYARLAALFAL